MVHAAPTQTLNHTNVEWGFAYAFYLCFSSLACNNSVDLLFVMDGGTLPIKKNFMKAVIDKFYIGVSDTRVGLLLTGGVGEVMRPFSASQSVDAIKTYLDGLRDVGSSPGITSGLTRALEVIKDLRPDKTVKQVGFLSRQSIFIR